LTTPSIGSALSSVALPGKLCGSGHRVHACAHRQHVNAIERAHTRMAVARVESPGVKCQVKIAVLSDTVGKLLQLHQPV